MASKSVDILWRLINRIDQRAISLRTATVISFTSTKAIISIGGGTITKVPYLATYSPTVGDKVQVLQKTGLLLILGKVA